MEEEKAISELFLNIMSDYSDSVIPPLSYFSPLPQTTTITTRSRSRNRDRKAQLPQEQTHTISRKDVLVLEQLRRQKVSDLFKVLQTMVPTLHLKPTSTQATVVWETIHYITELEQKILKLEANREVSAAAMAAHSYTHQKSSVEVTVSGDIAFFGIETVLQKGLAVRALMVMEQNQAEVLAANITANDHKLTLTITALVKKNDGDEVQRIRKDLLLLLS